MAQSSLSDPYGDLGRHLTIDVGALALSLAMIARGAFSAAVQPIIYVASFALVALFLTPFRSLPFVPQHTLLSLGGLRTIAIVLALGIVVLDGLDGLEPQTLGWYAMVAVAALAATTLIIDLRRVFPA